MIVVGHGDPRGNADRAVGGRAGGARELGRGRRPRSSGWSERAKIVLAAAAGMASRAIAREVGCARGVVSKWRVRFASDRLAGLGDAPRSGKPRTYREDADRRILAVLDRPPPEGFARWTAPLIAHDLGDVSDQYVWRFLRAQRIDLAGRKSWCLSTDPEFAAKAADIIGLYLAPPEHAIVLAVDEKPAIQALERAQGYLKLPNGRALTGFAHEYKRRGTTTLFTALDVATGQIKAKHTKRRRRAEFLDFMNDVIADYPDREIHVVLDNLKTHKPKRDRWLARHQERPLPLHPDPRQLAQPGRDLVLDPRPQHPRRCQLHLGAPAARRDRCLHHRLQHHRHTLPMAQGQGPPQEPHPKDHELMIVSTSTQLA